MRKELMRSIKLTLLVFISLLTGVQGVHANETVKVATTILPIKNFVEKVGGDKVEAFSLIPPGGNPHTYEPTPGQMKKFSEVDLFVKLSMHFEFEETWIPKLEKLNKKVKTVNSSRNITPIPMIEGGHHDHHDHHDHGQWDPHTWVSIKNAMVIASTIKDALVDHDPANADYYRENAQNFLIELDDLHQEIKQSLNDKKQRAIFIYHPAWGYFAHDYGLEQVVIEQHGKEPSAKDLARFVKQANDRGIKAIFTSPEFSDKSAKVIASEIGGRVVSIDHLGENFVSNMREAGKAFQAN